MVYSISAVRLALFKKYIMKQVSQSFSQFLPEWRQHFYRYCPRLGNYNVQDRVVTLTKLQFSVHSTVISFCNLKKFTSQDNTRRESDPPHSCITHPPHCWTRKLHRCQFKTVNDQFSIILHFQEWVNLLGDSLT